MNDNADEESFCRANQTAIYAYLTSKQMPPFWIRRALIMLS